MTKKVLFFVLLVNCFLVHSQSLVIKSTIEILGNSCDKDTTTRKIEFQKSEEHQFRSIRAFTSTQCQNEFVLPADTGQYKMIISSWNCDEQVIPFIVKAGTKETTLGKTILSKLKKTVNLGEVTVVGNKKEFIKVDADKTTYLVKDNPALSSGSMSDAIRKLPGVIVSPSGNLNLNGKDVAIYIDGVPSNLSGQDLKNYIESLPANAIEKIELIDNPGASYEANTNGGVINIITRSNSFQRFSGILNLHYGTSHNNKYSPSLMLNGRRKTINWQLQTGYNYHEQTDYNTADRTFTTYTPYVVFNQDGTSWELNKNFYFRPMVNFRINENSNLILNYNLNKADNGTTTQSIVTTLPVATGINYTNLYNNRNKNNNNELVAKYKTKLDTLGKTVQVTAYYSRYDKDALGKSTQNQDNSYLYSLNNINLNLTNYYVKYDLELPFKGFQVNTGGKFNRVNAGDQGKYNLNNPASTLFDQPTYLNQLDFSYHETNMALYAELKKNIGKLHATVGVRVEDLKFDSKVLPLDTTVKGEMANIYPTFNLLYQFTPVLKMTGRYSRKVAMPPYSQLDPNNSGYFDQYSSQVGNQYLRPNFYDNYSVTFSAFDYANLGANYSYTKNVSLMTLNTEPNTLVSSQTFTNYGNIRNYNVYAAFPVPVGLITQGKAFFKQPMDMDKMSFFYFYIAYNRQLIKDYAYPDGGPSPFWIYAVNSQIVLPLELKLNLQYFYLTKGTFQIYHVDHPIQYWMVDLSRKFFNKKLELTVEASEDVKQQISFNTPNLKTNFSNLNDKLTFWFKLSYHFGKFKSKEQTEIDVEKKQVEGGGLPAGINIKP
ncbi:MAG: TonB-dependent receptor [Bacteroidota bacterium]|nr:TonB-dependent receptor [Bacteroidota bacterium]